MRRSPFQTVFVVVVVRLLFLQQATEDGVRGGGRSRQMRTKSLQKKGDILESILQSTETIDDRRGFQKEKSYSRSLESSHPSITSTISPPCTCLRTFCRRTPRLIVILPCFLPITLSPTSAKQTLPRPGQTDSFVSLPLSRYETFPASEPSWWQDC